MASIHRTRPGAEAIEPAEEGPATRIGDAIWMSPGISNSYAIATDEGRVVINAGLHVEAPIHRRSYDATCPGRTRTIVVTQSHADHFGGVRLLVDEGTDIAMQANFPIWRDDHFRLPEFRMRNASFAWGHITEAIVERLQHLAPEDWTLTYPEPTQVVQERLELDVGGRQIVLLSTPGGETTDALVVWLPEDHTVFTGNLFGPLFGHVPNLVTIRGDRYRDALQYVESANTVLSLGAERLVTGHFQPIEGADLIAEEITALRDATQWMHDRTVEGMEAGTDVHTLMRDVRLPASLDVGEGYGKVAWNVRAIWESYAGWFHHRSTTELFDVRHDTIASDLVAVSSADALVHAAMTRLDRGEALPAIHLTEVVLAVEPEHAGARDVAARAHQRLLDASENYWERAWLRRKIERLRGGK